MVSNWTDDKEMNRDLDRRVAEKVMGWACVPNSAFGGRVVGVIYERAQQTGQKIGVNLGVNTK